MDKENGRLVSGLRPLQDRLHRAMADAEKHAKILGDAELQNKKIPPRAVHVMEGNRESYIRRTHDFLERLDPDFDCVDEIAGFISRTRQALDSLAKSNVKSYAVLQEFLAQESGAVARNIKEIEQAVNDIEKAVEASKMKTLGELTEAVEALKSARGQKAALEQQIRDKRQEISKEKDNERRLVMRLEALHHSSEYERFDRLVRSRDEALGALKVELAELSSLFSSLEHGFRKLARLSPDSLLDAYLADPEQALLDDENLRIFEFGKALEKHMVDGTIEMKDKRRERTLASVQQLSRDSLMQQRSRIMQSRRDKKILDEKISRDSAMANVKELEYNLSHSRHKLQSLEESLEHLEKALARHDMEPIIKRIAEKAHESLGIELSISLQ